MLPNFLKATRGYFSGKLRTQGISSGGSPCLFAFYLGVWTVITWLEYGLIFLLQKYVLRNYIDFLFDAVTKERPPLGKAWRAAGLSPHLFISVPGQGRKRSEDLPAFKECIWQASRAGLRGEVNPLLRSGKLRQLMMQGGSETGRRSLFCSRRLKAVQIIHYLT